MVKEYDGRESDVFKHTLTTTQIRSYKEKGLIAPDIDQISSKVKFAKDTKWMTQSYLMSKGIRVAFVRSSPHGPFLKDSFYLTDFFLIRCKRCDEGADLSFIPLEYVEHCTVDFKDNWAGYVAPVYGKEKKSPLVGALVGGAIAGTPGAVVGAMVNSGEKTVAYTPGGLHDRDSYSLFIKIQDGEPYEIEDYVTIDKTKKDATQKKIEIEAKNKTARDLINRATSLDDKKTETIVKQVQEETQKAKKTEKKDLLIGVFWLVVLIVMFVIVAIYF